MIVLQLASKHPGAGWRSYDRQFRQHQAAGAGLPWADLNPSLMAATVLGHTAGGPGRTCSLCLSSDHSKEDCALASLEYAKGGDTSQTLQSRLFRQFRRPTPYGPSNTAGVCYRYNRGTCLAARCRFDHSCSNCSKPGHPAISCPDPKHGPSDYRDGKSPPPPPPPQRFNVGRAR